MNLLNNVKPGIVAEWMSIIDPKGANDRNYDEKVMAVLNTQAELLLNSNMKEIRAQHWILSKRKTKAGIVIDFSLIAYKASTVFPLHSEQIFHNGQLSKLKRKLQKAIEAEDYMKAAKIRDLLNQLTNEGPAVA